MVAAMGADEKLLLELARKEDLFAPRALKKSFHMPSFPGALPRACGKLRIPASEGTRDEESGKRDEG